jgi:hypothetical protein
MSPNQYTRPGSDNVPIAVNNVVLITTPEGTTHASGCGCGACSGGGGVATGAQGTQGVRGAQGTQGVQGTQVLVPRELKVQLVQARKVYKELLVYRVQQALVAQQSITPTTFQKVH